MVLSILLAALMTPLTKASSIDSPSQNIELAFGVIEQEISKLKSHDEFTKNKIKSLLNQYLLPEINTRYFALKSLGQHAKSLPEDIKLAFVSELQIQLISSYANLLSQHSDEKIVFGNTSLSKSGKFSQVALTIENKGKNNNAVVKLVKNAEGDWKIFDIVIQGISLLQTKQAEMNASINKIGIDATLEKLKLINAKTTT